ncbi:tripartite tricarboxylate transporter permease [Paracoccus sp. PAR01]|uniref:tripartite tricarboxylate transporter permease n=1 Tax=Paracoccus sp. PAR01 TaxID=2769282 RepID=UPI00351C8550
MLTLYNLTPGSTLFTTQPDLVCCLIASLFIGNVILLAMSIPLVGGIRPDAASPGMATLSRAAFTVRCP